MSKIHWSIKNYQVWNIFKVKQLFLTITHANKNTDINSALLHVQKSCLKHSLLNKILIMQKEKKEKKKGTSTEKNIYINECMLNE